MGLVKALERYAVRQHDGKAVLPVLEAAIARIGGLPGLAADIEQDEAGRDIYRIRIRVDAAAFGCDATTLEQRLRNSNPAIYARRYKLNAGEFSLDPRALKDDDLELIIDRLTQLARAQKKEHS